MFHAFAIRFRIAAKLRGFGRDIHRRMRRWMVPVAIMRHDARYLLDELPVDDEDEPVPDEEPELDPEPVSVEDVAGVVELVVSVELGAVEAVVDVVSFVVDELVGEVVLAGVELVPELLYEVLVPGVLLQPARAPVARAMAAT